MALPFWLLDAIQEYFPTQEDGVTRDGRGGAEGIVEFVLGEELGLDGKEGSVILTDRNTVALAVLAKELKAGKKSLAIFYGAAHMPDLEKRMIEKMGFERKGARWVTAWDLPPRKK